MKKEPIHKIKSHVFNGKRFRFVYGNFEKKIGKKETKEIIKNHQAKSIDEIDAITHHPDQKNKAIMVRDDLSEKELLETLLDEGIHAVDFSIDNEFVDVYSKDLASFLWRCGYRRVKSEDVTGNNGKG